jgi:hypothetical protein
MQISGLRWARQHALPPLAFAVAGVVRVELCILAGRKPERMRHAMKQPVRASPRRHPQNTTAAKRHLHQVKAQGAADNGDGQDHTKTRSRDHPATTTTTRPEMAERLRPGA